MNDSILGTIKKMLGLDDNYTPFDMDVLVFLNSALMTLHQLGVGPENGLVVSDYTETWNDLNPSGIMMEAVKTYLYICVKMAFDPPNNSFVMEAMKQQKEELEWRLREQVEHHPGGDA